MLVRSSKVVAMMRTTWAPATNQSAYRGSVNSRLRRSSATTEERRTKTTDKTKAELFMPRWSDPKSGAADKRSEEHTTELQSLMRITYAVLCLKQKATEYNTNKKY